MTGAAGAAAQAAGKNATLFDWAMLLFGVVSIALLVRELRQLRAADETAPDEEA